MKIIKKQIYEKQKSKYLKNWWKDGKKECWKLWKVRRLENREKLYRNRLKKIEYKPDDWKMMKSHENRKRDNKRENKTPMMVNWTEKKEKKLWKMEKRENEKRLQRKLRQRQNNQLQLKQNLFFG